MMICVEATKPVLECHTMSKRGKKVYFCNDSTITQKVCVRGEQNIGETTSELHQRTHGALDQADAEWRKITRVEKPLIMAPMYHCISYQYHVGTVGGGALQEVDECGWVQLVFNYIFR